MVTVARRCAVRALLVCVAVACGGAPSTAPDDYYERTRGHGRVAATTEAERALLVELLAAARGPATLQVAGLTVDLGEGYAAASGLECRTVRVRTVQPAVAAGGRLACRDGDGWFFAPDVGASGEGPGSGT